MSEPKQYEIQTVADFAKVPPRRLRTCLKEFATCIEMHRATQDLLQAVQAELYPGSEPVGWPLHKFTWVDDKRQNVTMKLSVSPRDG